MRLFLKLSKRCDKVAVHLENGPTIEGILLGMSRRHYVLTAATAVKDEESSYTIDGEARIPRRRVVFYQVFR